MSDLIEDMIEVANSQEPNFQKEILQLLLLKQRPEATERIVIYLKTKYIFKTTRVDDKNEVWLYKDGIYIPEGKTYIQEETRKILMDVYTTNIVNLIISKIEADTFIDQEKFFNEQNNYPEQIPVLNGILNIKTRELKEFTPIIPYFNKIPIVYDTEKKSDKFIIFLKEILKTENDTKIIQELFGYSLYKKYKYKKSFMFEGGGDNGKSQLLKILTEKFLGIENTKNVSLAQIERDPFILSELHNKLVNVSADITSNVLDNTGNFKNVTGGDPISCNRKFKNTITFVNYAKMIFATNELPISKDNSSGFWGRWSLIEFPHRFLIEKEYKLLSNEEKENVKIAIPNIIDEIINEEELSGILNWALDGFERLEKNKEFSDNNSRDQTKKKWLMKANSVMAFIDEFIEEDYDGYMIKNDFKQNYLKYCSENKLKRVSDKVIKITLENELNAYSNREYILNEQKHVWSGIRFKSTKSAKTPISASRGDLKNCPIGRNTMSSLTYLTQKKSLNFDIIQSFIEDKIDFSIDLLEFELKEKYNFNENQLIKYIEKLLKIGFIGKFGKNKYKVI